MTALITGLVPRSAWAATPATAPFEAHTIDHVTIHHTAISQDDRATSVRLRAYQRYHQQQGWPDIAYHLLIGADGLVYEGRTLEARGDSATGYDTTGHLLVAVDGDFSEEVPARAQFEALLDTLAWASETYALDPREIRGHSAHAATACPGDHLAVKIEDGSLAELVRARLARLGWGAARS